MGNAREARPLICECGGSGRQTRTRVILVESGFLSHEEVAELLALQAGQGVAPGPANAGGARTWRIGSLAVRSGFATRQQVNRALREQAKAEEEGRPWVPLGEILVQQGASRSARAAATWPGRLETHARPS